ncbi:SirB2 family protein [Amphritea balenae]|nr:SirB2 family protein [Amphritea balenae]
MVLKHTHMTCAAISILFFSIRGYWMLTDSHILQQRWVRILPHIVDTLLLASAIALTILLSQYPFSQSWLTAKLFALIAYILLGTIALKRGKTKAMRILALMLALTTAGYIVWVALSHYPWPWLL